jgi:putative membrane protein
MNGFTVRAIIVSMLVAVLFVPLYAHHGSQFLSKAMEMNTAEVRFAELATTKAQSPRVKEYAQMLIRDHNAALEKLRDMREARMASATQPNQPATTNRPAKDVDVQLTAQHQRTLDKLSGLSGAEFDREFMNLTVNEHRNAIRAFESQTRAHGNMPASKQTDTTKQGTTREKPTAPDKYSKADLNRDMDTADFANATLPTIRHHLQQAMEIQKLLPKT